MFCVKFLGHTNSVDQLCWDDKHADLIASASGDKVVCLWDARSGKCSQQAELSGENINITYKPDGTHVAVGNRPYLECSPENCYAWSKYAELERSLAETDRARGIFELAIAQPALDMLELLWKGCLRKRS